MTSRPTVLASIVLALALLGDSLLYAVLPLHADDEEAALRLLQLEGAVRPHRSATVLVGIDQRRGRAGSAARSAATSSMPATE